MWWLHFLAAAGFSFAGSIVPIFNSEAYAIGAGVLGVSAASAVLIGLALGHVGGKLLVLLGIRRGLRLPWIQRKVTAVRDKMTHSTADDAAHAGWITRLLGGLSHERYQVPILLLAASIGVPPVYAATVYLAGTRMRWWVFSVTVGLGFLVRYGVTIFATGTVREWVG